MIGRRLGALLACVVCSIVGAAHAAERRLDRIETYTVVYAQTGVMTGTMTVHSREFGNRRAELADVVVAVGTMKLPMKQRTIVEGDRVTSIDEAAGTAEVTKHPEYAKTVEAMARSTDAEAVNELLKTVWSASPTGATRTYAGEECNELVSADGSSSYCVTGDGIFLFLSQGPPQMRFERTATAVRRGDGGPDDAFRVPAGIHVTDGGGSD